MDVFIILSALLIILRALSTFSCGLDVKELMAQAREELVGFFL